MKWRVVNNSNVEFIFLSHTTYYVTRYNKNCINYYDPNIVQDKMHKYYNIKHFINKPTMLWIWPLLSFRPIGEKPYSTARVLVISAIVFYHFDNNICDKRLFAFFFHWIMYIMTFDLDAYTNWSVAVLSFYY